MLVGTIILSIGIFNGVMLSVILWMNKKQRFLAAGILVYSALLLKYLGYWVGLLPDSQVIAEQVRSMELLMGPLILGGIYRLQGRKPRREWMHYIPFVSLQLILLVYTMIEVIQNGIVPPFYPQQTMIFKLGHELLYLAYLVVYLKGWTKPFVLLVSFFALQWTISVFYAIYRFEEAFEVLNIVLFAGMSFSINYLAYIALRNTSIFPSGIGLKSARPPGTGDVEKDRPDDSERIEVDLRPIFDNVVHVLEHEQMYLNHSLKLSNISETLKVQEKLVSKAVNEHAKENFNAYINRFRVDYAANLIVSDTHSHFTIDAIAEESGFANKVSFYKAFKRVKGVSPSEFRKERMSAL
ncbi:MAG: helix-turn-helix domain-containing protein [Bacteroidota bacterium]